MPAWLRINEVADRTGFSRHQIYRRIQSGRLPATLDRAGKMKYLIKESDVQRYLIDSDGREVQVQDTRVAMLRIAAVAKMLGFTAETVRRMCESGDLTHVRGAGPHGHYRIPREAVREYLDKLNNKSA